MIKKQSLFLLIISLISLLADTEVVCAPNGRAIMKALASHKGPRIYLLSFPKSGNTWMRYCIEFLTQRPTASYSLRPDAQTLPISYTFGYPLALKKAAVWKAHNRSELNFAGRKHDHQRDLLILIVRNPKEAIARWMGTVNTSEMLKGSGLIHFRSYFDALDVFDKWDSNKKILIYYEDLISHPRETLSKVVQFLDDSENNFDLFFGQYETHKARGLKFYDYNGGSQSQGNDLLYHSRKMSSEGRKIIDLYLETSYSFLWQMYLESRYSEEVLDMEGLYKNQIINNIYRKFILGYQ